MPSAYGYRSGITAIMLTDPGPAFIGVSVKDSLNVCGAHPNVGWYVIIDTVVLQMTYLILASS